MNRNELVDQCKRLIAEAYEEATEMVVAYIEIHQGEPLQSLCKEIDPDNWSALDARVRRLRQKRRSEGESAPTRTLSNQQSSARHARATMRNSEISPDHKASIVAEADAETKRAIFERLASDDAVRANSETVHRATRNLAGANRPTPKPEPAAPSLSDAWHAWLSKINNVLMDGARLAERTETSGAAADTFSELGYLVYQRITEKKLDAEIRSLLDSDGANV